MRRGLLAAVFALAALPGAAQELGGRYTVSGKGMDGSAYTGEAEIVVKDDLHCTISWKTGGSTSDGMCMRMGDVFSAAFVLEGRIGMLVYTMKPDGALDGSWTMSGIDGVGYERLTPAP